MGLDKLRGVSGLAILRLVSVWGLPLAIAIACAGIALGGDEARLLLRYDRTGIGDGQFWRLGSAHLTHLGPSHLILNLAGLGLVWLLVGQRLQLRDWIVVTAIVVFGIDLGFWFVDVHLNWYVGLSGVLHGLLLAGAIGSWRVARSESLMIIAVVVLKLLWEQLYGPLPGSEASSGGNVIVNAHLYGAIAGALAAAVTWRSAGKAAAI